MICSGDYLRRQFTEADTALVANDLCMFFHPEDVSARLPGFNHNVLPNLQLHSDLYRQWKKEIPVIILDESQDAKNMDKKLNAAIRSLSYHHIVMVSGTPIHNRWEDWPSQAAMLPNSGMFKSQDHFRWLFNNGQVMKNHLPQAQHQVFSYLVAGLTIARPKANLSLPPVIKHEVEVHIPPDSIEILKIRRYMRSARILLSRELESENTGTDSSTEAFCLIAAAQKLAANPLLLYNNVNIGIDDRVNGTLSSEDVSSDNENAALTIEARRLRAGYRRILHEEGFSYNQNSVDSLNNCLSEAEDEEEDEQDHEEDDEEDDEDEKEDDPFDAPVHQEPTIKRKRANPNYTKRWLEFLQSQENDKIFSPRVNAIISTLARFG